MADSELRSIQAPFIVSGPSGVSIRTRLKGLTPGDEVVLRAVGAHLGAPASGDLKRRCADGLDHSTDTWAQRERDLTKESSSRWAGSITRATHDQWASARRAHLAHIRALEAGIATIAHRMSLPVVGEKGAGGSSGGYRTRQEWFAKSRRLHVLKDRLNRKRAEWESGRVRVVRGGKKLARTRHNLAAAKLAEQQWRQRWEAGRWYLTASGTIPPVKTVPLDQARRGGSIGVDTDADHLAAWRLDEHGNPCGAPLRFSYDLSGDARHRDAQVWHALTRLLHWAARHNVSIAIENLDFAAETTREKHGRCTRFRRLISGMPVSRLRARLVGMTAELGITIIAVDPAYTTRWGAEHWRKPMATPRRTITRHDAASVAIGRRALGHRIRRRAAAPPHDDQSDRRGYRTAQAVGGTAGVREPAPISPGPRTRSAGAGYGANAGDQDTQHRSECPTEPVQLTLSLEER